MRTGMMWSTSVAMVQRPSLKHAVHSGCSASTTSLSLRHVLLYTPLLAALAIRLRMGAHTGHCVPAGIRRPHRHARCMYQPVNRARLTIYMTHHE